MVKNVWSLGGIVPNSLGRKAKRIKHGGCKIFGGIGLGGRKTANLVGTANHSSALNSTSGK